MFFVRGSCVRISWFSHVVESLNYVIAVTVIVIVFYFVAGCIEDKFLE
jgi:hypothetical protein